MSKTSDYPPSLCRVLVVIGQYPPAHSGAGLRIHRTYKRLQQAGSVEFKVLCYSDRVDEGAVAFFDGVEVQRVAPARRRDFVRSLWTTLSESKQSDVDVVHCIGDVALTDAVALLCWVQGVPFVREVSLYRDWLDQINLVQQYAEKRNIKQAIVRWIQYRLKRTTFRRASLLVAMNRKIEGFYARLGADREKVLLRPNPVDSALFFIPSEECRDRSRKELEPDSQGIMHLLVGRFDPRKNQSFAVEALSSLPENHFLVLAGPAFDEDQEYLGALKDQIEALGLSSRVTIVPEMRDDIPRFYQTADSLWVVSENEGTPNVLLEGLVCGLPVFVNDRLSLDEFVGSDDGAILTLESRAFAQEVERVVSLETEEVRQARSLRANQRFGAGELDKLFVERLMSASHG